MFIRLVLYHFGIVDPAEVHDYAVIPETADTDCNQPEEGYWNNPINVRILVHFHLHLLQFPLRVWNNWRMHESR